ncbi:MAG: cystathionine gamma-synthase [Chloroflexota bacterium]|nr:cystathionine gamma-synthase [Chloroflexota bacterium]MDQ5864750.1 cystathionine gamma-synthase [Chloroflexota bacterium]
MAEQDDTRPKSDEPRYGFETRAIHAGQDPDPTTGAVIVPIYQTSTYVQEKVGEHKGYEYSRTGNPTRTALEKCIASLEDGKHGLAFGSGMGAETTIMYLFSPGDHVLVSNDVYGGTYRLFDKILQAYGLQFSYIDMTDPESVREHMRDNTKAVWIETPSNPMMKLIDLTAVAAIAKERGAKTIVDNTFASPYGQQPLMMGVDIVVHSSTKYLGGHSDAVGGVVVTSDDEVNEKLRFLQNAVGAVPGPMDCFLVLRGIKTLGVRMRAHESNAMKIARFLEDQPTVERVLYPGLASHPQHDLAGRQMRCFGGMISFLAKGGLEEARRISESTRLFQLAESLGGVESLIEHPGIMTHASVAASPLRVPDNLVRLSVGIENSEDLIRDLANAMR